MATLMPHDATTLLIWILVSLAAFVFVLCAGLLISSGWVSHWQSKAAARHFERDRERIYRLLKAKNAPSRIAIRGRSTMLRDHIVKLAQTVTGDPRPRLVELYETLGFAKRDLRALTRGRFRERAEALRRCRSLELPLPQAEWHRLLHHSNFVFRWAAMEYLIALKGTKALPQFLSFMADKRNANKGAVLHLLACLAKTHPETIVFLLGSTDDQDLIELLLWTLASYPAEGALDAVLANIRANSSPVVLTAAINALMHYPDVRLTELYQNLSVHTDWRVRAAVARALGSYPAAEAAGLLERFCVDGSYQVRQQAVMGLASQNAGSAARSILIDAEHPSHLLLRDLISGMMQMLPI